jgi:hypothetical protein
MMGRLVVYGEAVGDLNRRSSGEQEKGRRGEAQSTKEYQVTIVKSPPSQALPSTSSSANFILLPKFFERVRHLQFPQLSPPQSSSNLFPFLDLRLESLHFSFYHPLHLPHLTSFFCQKSQNPNSW